MALCDSCGQHVVGDPSNPAIDCMCTQRCPNCMQPVSDGRPLDDLCDTCAADPAVPGVLAGAQVALLRLLEDAPGPRGGRWEAEHRPILDQLAAWGVARATTTNWVITNDGRRALTGHDGRTRLAVQAWGRNAYDPPTPRGA